MVFLAIVILNDIRCIVSPPWEKGTFQQIRNRLEADEGWDLLERIIPKRGQKKKKRLREDLEKYMPSLFRPFIERLFAQQAIRLGATLLLFLCSTLSV